MTERTRLITNFLRTAGWADAKHHPLAADASMRSYIRLSHGNNTAILMNAPPATNESVGIFANVTDMLLGFNLAPPRIFARDVENGFLLIEDLGDNLYAKICASDPSCEQSLYTAAVDVLVELARHPAPKMLAAYDMAVYQREAALIPDWYLPAMTDTQTDPDLSAQYNELIKSACQKLDTQTSCLVMRDYHAENLIWLPEGTDVARVGLLDYQDALAGHPAYDLVSLLEDARRDTSVTLQNAMKSHYVKATGIDQDMFERDYHILGAQRNLKIIGIFTRLSTRDGKRHYVDLIPRVWEHLQRDLTHDSLADLRKWINQNLPEPTVKKIGKIKRYQYDA